MWVLTLRLRQNLPASLREIGLLDLMGRGCIGCGLWVLLLHVFAWRSQGLPVQRVALTVLPVMKALRRRSGMGRDTALVLRNTWVMALLMDLMILGVW